MTAQFVEFKSANSAGIVQIVANKGICWQVQDSAGELFLIQKKHVVRGPWLEEDEPEADAPSAPPLLTAALAQVTAPSAPTASPTAPAPTATGDADLVTLKQLCFDLNLEPRIARRVLRKAYPKVGTGARWEWRKDDAELVAIRTLLNRTPAAAAADAASE